jgi:hypothetical protein
MTKGLPCLCGHDYTAHLHMVPEACVCLDCECNAFVMSPIPDHDNDVRQFRLGYRAGVDAMHVHGVSSLLLLDLFTMAMEGGIQHWGDVTTYSWRTPEGYGDAVNFEATVYERGTADMVHVVNRHTMARGLGRLATGRCTLAGHAMDTTTRGEFAAALWPRENEEQYWDAFYADLVVQAGLFGDIRYG